MFKEPNTIEKPLCKLVIATLYLKGNSVEKIAGFSNWLKFPGYLEYEGRKLPGVYILGRFNRKPSSTPILNSKSIVYVGETTKQNIHKRLYQFSISAFKRKNGHSGGWTYSDKYLDNKTIVSAPSDLYVSILAVNREKDESKAYIKYIERLLIWEYYKKHKCYPSCNTA